jgi:hypothetical protein
MPACDPPVYRPRGVLASLGNESYGAMGNQQIYGDFFGIYPETLMA